MWNIPVEERRFSAALGAKNEIGLQPAPVAETTTGLKPKSFVRVHAALKGPLPRLLHAAFRTTLIAPTAEYPAGACSSRKIRLATSG
jgi:hypothetical protein